MVLAAQISAARSLWPLSRAGAAPRGHRHCSPVGGHRLGVDGGRAWRGAVPGPLWPRLRPAWRARDRRTPTGRRTAFAALLVRLAALEEGRSTAAVMLTAQISAAPTPRQW